jgi:2-succinyl-5-enolpyruvyl-6-hydroxy-3-cyclohexene-1-carboxylate synthase
VLEGLPEADGADSAAASPYAQLWHRAETLVRGALDAALREEASLVEPKAAWLLSQTLPGGTPLFVANSMPVRDMEYFFQPTSSGVEVHFNRGANGIDGTLSTALGLAHRSRPAVLLTGDLALLHDSNGFLIRPKFKGSLTIVLINNRGGGIFNHLAISKFDPPFEEFFATPQEADFALLAAAHKTEHIRVEDWDAFVRLTSVLPQSGLRILELATDRTGDASFRKELFERVSSLI